MKIKWQLLPLKWLIPKKLVENYPNLILTPSLKQLNTENQVADTICTKKKMKFSWGAKRWSMIKVIHQALRTLLLLKIAAKVRGLNSHDKGPCKTWSLLSKANRKLLIQTVTPKMKKKKKKHLGRTSKWIAQSNPKTLRNH
jgi:hypothetical protein